MNILLTQRGRPGENGHLRVVALSLVVSAKNGRHAQWPT